MKWLNNNILDWLGEGEVIESHGPAQAGGEGKRIIFLFSFLISNKKQLLCLKLQMLSI